MDTNVKVKELITTLLNKGYSEDQVAEICAHIGEAAFEQFMAGAKNILGEDGFAAIEAMPTDTEAHEELKRQYQAKTGQDAQSQIDTIINLQVDSYLSDEEMGSGTWQ